MNPDLFEDAESYVPERWLTRYQKVAIGKEKENGHAKDAKDGYSSAAPFNAGDSWYGFSAGSRVCIAKK